MKTRTKPMGSFRRCVLSTGVALLACAGITGHADAQSNDGRTFPLWEPFAPPQNPPSAERQILGKILFWDEQLSSDNTVSCGTCHIPSAGGNDPRPGLNPGFDELFMNEDDIAGSRGVIRSDADGEYLRSVLFELMPQVTPRRSMSNHIAPYAGNLFWDGRAEGSFIDPVTGEELAQVSAALEVQSLFPITNDIEMAHMDRDWPSILSKLAQARPLALATDIPQDMLDAIDQHPSYPELFEQAFGTPEITAGRIGFALANYQRTLIPNQTPWDQWNAGDDNAMTPQQLEGWNAYRASACMNCHSAPLYTNMDFMVDGVRPPHEDEGRAIVTGVPFERGAFRTGTLRNIGMRDRFMHTGGLSTLEDVFDFYGQQNGLGPFSENLSFALASVLPIRFSPEDREAAIHFIRTALVDPRAANEEPPFDRPTLYSEREIRNPKIIPGGNSGTGGFAPRIIAVVPPNIGNTDFKVGVDFALGGAQAWVAVSQSPPTNGVVASDELIGPITLNGILSGEGYGTAFYLIDDPALEGQTFYTQWIIADPNAPGGLARSDIAKFVPFCTMRGSCTPSCPGDFNGDGNLDFFDISGFVQAFGMNDPAADMDGNGQFNFFDVSDFLTAFTSGCP